MSVTYKTHDTIPLPYWRFYLPQILTISPNSSNGSLTARSATFGKVRGSRDGALNPRKKGFTRIPPTLGDTTSRPAGHASRRRTHWRNEQGADARNKTHKKKSTKNMKDNQQTHLKGTSQSLHYTTQRTHARLFLERGAAFLPSFPQPSGEY